MKVHLLFSHVEAPLLTLTVRAWKANGFEVRVILSGQPRPRTGLVVSPRLINFSWRARQGKASFKQSVKRFGSKGWQSAPLVAFPRGTSVEAILACGRYVPHPVE